MKNIFAKNALSKTHGYFLASFLFVLSWFLLGCGDNAAKEVEKKLNEAAGLASSKEVEKLKEAVGKYEETIALALEAIKGKYEAQKLMGIQLAYAKNYPMCVDVLEGASQMNMGDSSLMYFLGLCKTHLAMNTDDENEKNTWGRSAKSSFAKGIEIDGDDHLCYYGMGVLEGFVFEETKQAIGFLETAYNIENADVNVLFSLAHLYYKNGNVNQAAERYRESMALLEEGSERWKIARDNLLDLQARN